MAKNGLAKIGLAQIGQIRMAKTGLAKVGPFRPQLGPVAHSLWFRMPSHRTALCTKDPQQRPEFIWERKAPCWPASARLCPLGCRKDRASQTLLRCLNLEGAEQPVLQENGKVVFVTRPPLLS